MTRPGLSWAVRCFGLLLISVLIPFLFTGCPDSTTPDGGVACSDDMECAVGEYCNAGICTPIGGDDDPQVCTFDADCPSGEICENGLCQIGQRDDGGLDGTDGDGGGDADGSGDGDQVVLSPALSLAGDVITHQDAQGTTYEINFGNVTVGVPVSRNLTIGNGGDGVLEISVVTLQDDPSSEFTLSPAIPPAISIEPGEDHTVVVDYVAIDGQTDRALARIFSNDPLKGEIEIQLISEFKGEAAIALDPPLIDFGEVAIDDVQSRQLTIANNGSGNAVLTVDEVAVEAIISTAFDVSLTAADGTTALTPPVFINRGEFVLAEVSFLAPARASYEGNLVIESNDPVTSSSTVLLRGRAGAPAIAVDPAAVDFGQVPADTWATDKTVTISNEGTGILEVSEISLTPSGGDLSLDNLPGSMPLLIDPAGQYQFAARFFPSGPGIDSATITIVHDDPDQSAVQIPVGGEGVQGNARPVAVIKADGQDLAVLQVDRDHYLALDGTGSSDNDGSLTAYEWRIVNQPSYSMCGSDPVQDSVLVGSTNPTASVVLRKGGLTTIGLRVQDDALAWSDEDLLDIQVASKPLADIWQGGNDQGYAECDMGDTLAFNIGSSVDCDGSISDFQWTVEEYPVGRGSAPNIGGGEQNASILFDFPGNYKIGLVLLDNDVPPNQSEMATFDVLVRGPKAFRVTADWRNLGNDDHKVDVDLHLMRPGYDDDEFGPNDCHPAKIGGESGNENPNWGSHGNPVYQVKNTMDPDGTDTDPNNPAEVINVPDPGLGQYALKVYFRCHNAFYMIGGDYWCCDDLCSDIFVCPLCAACRNITTDENYCPRQAMGKVRIYVTDYNNVETLIETRDFNFAANGQGTFQQIGYINWPDGTLQ